MKKIILLIVILFLNSCNNKVEKILITDNRWHMNAVEKEETIFLGQSFLFKDDGTYLYYHVINDTSGISETFDLHNTPKRKWLLKNDSIFLGDEYDKNFSYKIVKFNNDTLWLKNGTNNFLLLKKGKY